MSFARLYREIFSMELRRVSAYRVDFWMSTIASLLAQVLVAYFLWSSIFLAQGADTIRGLHFPDLMFYTLVAASVASIAAGSNHGNFWREIYDGSLSRYLVYPCSVFPFKLIRCFASGILDLLLLGIGLLLIYALVGPSESFHFSLLHSSMALVSIIFALVLYFLMAALVEFFGFWADNIWSLLVMVQITNNLFGGGMFPLAMFPEWAQSLLLCTPFPYTISYPTLTFLGKVSPGEWLQSLCICSAWIGVCLVLGRMIWRRGLKQYSGVGM